MTQRSLSRPQTMRFTTRGSAGTLTIRCDAKNSRENRRGEKGSDMHVYADSHRISSPHLGSGTCGEVGVHFSTCSRISRGRHSKRDDPCLVAVSQRYRTVNKLNDLQLEHRCLWLLVECQHDLGGFALSELAYPVRIYVGTLLR